MERFYKSNFEDFNLKFNDSHNTKEKLFKLMLEWFVKMEAFSGETIMQSDEPRIEAAPFLSEIADDVFEFEVTYPDEKSEPAHTV